MGINRTSSKAYSWCTFNLNASSDNKTKTNQAYNLKDLSFPLTILLAP